MDKTQQIELIRKRNADLNKQLEDLKAKLESGESSGQQAGQRESDLVMELESLRDEWNKALDDIHQKQKEYEDLLDNIKTIRDTMKGISKVSSQFAQHQRLPWYTRAYMKLTRKRWMSNDESEVK